jgi:KDO2-lipid IV(A) lauroyltransferase
MDDVKAAVEQRVSRLQAWEATATLTAHAGIFDATAFTPYEMDSLGAVEVLASLGEDLRLPLLDLALEGELSTFGDLLRHVEQAADRGHVATFCQRWGRGGTAATAASAAPTRGPTDADVAAARPPSINLVTPIFRFWSRVARYVPAAVFETVGARIWQAGSLVPSRRRTMATRHQRRIAPAADAKVIQRRVREVYRSYGRYYLESFRLSSVSGDELDRRMSVDGLEHVEAALTGGRGAIAVLPHLGSWEWGAHWFSSVRGLPVVGVAERIEPAALFEWFTELRERAGVDVVPLDNMAAPTLVRALRANSIVALLGDRDLTGTGARVEFFGEKTTLPLGPALLGLVTGAPLLAAALYDQPGGRHHLVIRPSLRLTREATLREDAARLTSDVARVLELLIRRAPDQWHVLQPNWPSDRIADRGVRS